MTAAGLQTHLPGVPHVYTLNQRNLMRDIAPELELEQGRVKRNLPLNTQFVVPGRIFVILYTVKNKQGGLVRHMCPRLLQGYRGS